MSKVYIVTKGNSKTPLAIFSTLALADNFCAACMAKVKITEFYIDVAVDMATDGNRLYYFVLENDGKAYITSKAPEDSVRSNLEYISQPVEVYNGLFHIYVVASSVEQGYDKARAKLSETISSMDYNK